MYLTHERSNMHFSVILHIDSNTNNPKTIVKHKDSKTWELEFRVDGKFKHVRCTTLEKLCNNEGINLNELLDYMPELIIIGDVYKLD